MPTDEEIVVKASMRDELSRPMAQARRATKDTADEVRRLDHSSASASRSAGSLTSMATKLGGALGSVVKRGATVAVAAIAAVSIGVVALAGHMVGLATDAGETASKFGTVFGPAAGQVSAFNKRMVDDFGMTTKAMQDATSTFGVFGKSAGIPAGEIASFSTDLTQAGLDLSSFYNVASEGADGTFAAIRSGLTGEAEPLRRFGIFLSDASMKAKAATMGLNGELTESQKVAVRQKIILEQLGDANGDLARTSGSLANQQRALKGRFEEAQTAIGLGFVPVVQLAVGWLSGKLQPAVALIAKWAPMAGEAFVAAFSGEGITTELGNAVGVAERLGVALRWLVDTGKEVAGGGGLGAVTDRLRDVGPAGVVVADTLERVINVGRDLWTILRDGLLPAFNDANDAIGVIPSPLRAVEAGLGFVADHAKTLRPLLTALIAGWLAYRVASTAVNTVTAVGNGIRFLATASTAGLAAAQAGATGATGGLAVGTGILNAVMSANPIVLIVAGLAALAAGLVLAYQKVGWFHAAVDGAWQVIQVAWDWITKLGGYLLTFNPVTGPFILLLKNLPTVFDAIKTAAGFVVDVFKKVWSWVDKVAKALEKMGGPLGDVLKVANKIPGVGRLVPGDTTRPRGGGALSSSLASHDALEASTPGRRYATRTTGGPSRSGDHPGGRAIDWVGSGLGAYRHRARRAGHYAEFHGTGNARHLHVAYRPRAFGDTPRPRARAMATAGGGGGDLTLVMGEGAVQVNNPASELDLETGIARGIDRWFRDKDERG